MGACQLPRRSGHSGSDIEPITLGEENIIELW